MHERPIRTDVPNWYCMKGKKVIWLIIAVAAALIIGLLLGQRARRLRVVAERLSVPIEGAVIQRDADTNKQLPIADVVITASDGLRSAATRSDASGYFKLVLHKRVLSDLPTPAAPRTGFKQQGQVYAQHPDPNECRQLGQDLPGGQPGKRALRPQVTLFARWQVEGNLGDAVARCRRR